MTAPMMIFCSNPLNPREVEPIYADEFDVARKLGFETVIINHDYLDLDHEVDVARALGKQTLPDGKAVYRGWMMSYGAYRALYEALNRRGVELVTPPDAYADLHYFAGHPNKFRKFIPDTVEIPHPGARFASEDDYEDWLQDHVLMELASMFGNDDDEPVPVVLKDYVKSQADYWEEACFIPDALDRDEIERVLNRFIKLQGGLDGVQGGFVFRRYVDFAKSPNERAIEYRAVIVDHKVVGCWPRSETLCIAPSAQLLGEIAEAIDSPFFTADFCIESVTGKWWLIEAGDGQVSELPEAEPVFAALKAILI